MVLQGRMVLQDKRVREVRMALQENRVILDIQVNKE
jgi:hypothetical protein